MSNHDSYSDFVCALSASTIGSVSHPAGDRPSHPICEVPLSECGFLPLLRGGQLPISGKMNSALIEFEDGLRVVVSRNALRRVI